MTNDKIIACICEGSAESVIVNKLMDAGKLIFTRDDLLDNEVLRCRSARKFEDRYLGKGFKKKITVYRILDSRREDFKLRKAYESKVDVINVITAPEIEMLIIIHQGKYNDFCKVKSHPGRSTLWRRQRDKVFVDTARGDCSDNERSPQRVFFE